MKKTFYKLLGMLILFASCQKEVQDKPEEDYEKLFPFEGVESPQQNNGDAVVKPCDPDQKPEDYVYPGKEELEYKEKYTITLKYRFIEDVAQNSGNVIQSRYLLKYINDKKKLVMVSTNKNFKLEDEQSAPDVIVTNDMLNNRWRTKRFYVYSGFPLMLCVNGYGPRDSSIEAEITAVSESGLIPELKLVSKQYQNKEGVDRLEQPFCNFIVLP